MRKISNRQVSVGINNFVLRQMQPTFAGTQVTREQLEALRLSCETSLADGLAKPGYAPFVKIVQLERPDILTPVVRITPDNRQFLKTEKTRRRDSEEEYEHRFFPGEHVQRSPSHHVNVILYSREQLEKENSSPTGADYDIISINAEPYQDDTPIAPETIRRNRKGYEAGGSGHQHSDEELATSEVFWNEHSLVK